MLGNRGTKGWIGNTWCLCVCVCGRGREGEGARFNVLHWEHNFNAVLISPSPFRLWIVFLYLASFFFPPPPPKQVSHFLNRLIYCKPTATLLWRAHSLFAFPFPASPPFASFSPFLCRPVPKCSQQGECLPSFPPTTFFHVVRPRVYRKLLQPRTFPGSFWENRVFLKLPLVKSI